MYVAITKLHIDEFLKLAESHPVLDVRSPGEFEHAHIPGAYSLPLFTDEERKVVGTAYKKESREKAIKIGLKYFGKKMVKMVEEVENLQSSIKNLNNHSSTVDKTVLVHCWRGGMRSAGVAWLLDLYGFKVYSLVGGYKQYRKWVLEQFQKDYPITIIGGYTGSGKTELLSALAAKGAAIIDLEAIACHKGSAFGNLGMPKQPTQEQFENDLANALSAIVNSEKWEVSSKKLPTTHYPLHTIFVEDESQRIGEVNIPGNLFNTMRSKPVLFLDIPFEERLDNIVHSYGKYDQDKLLNAILRIQKKLGGLETKNAVNFLLEKDVHRCFAILLKYYDKLYINGLLRRENPEMQVRKIPCSSTNTRNNATAILQLIPTPSIP